MGADETGTMETLRRYRAAMATLIERHDGRVVNTWGDAVIAEFPSVVEAVQCAVETQQELSTYNGGLPEPRRMIFRIGIHLGDVMVEGDDVYGDGVNIAARLQERAEPGGILISGPVYDQVLQQAIHWVRLPRPTALEERRQPGDRLSRSSSRRGDAATRIAARCEDRARYASSSRPTGSGRPRFRLGMVQRAATR